MSIDNRLDNFISEKLSQFNFPHPSASLFGDLNVEIKADINNTFIENNIQNPLVFYSQLHSGWIVIASNGIIINSNNQIQSINFDKILSIQSDRNERLNKNNPNSTLTYELNNWIIKDKDNNEYLISIHSGLVWSSFYHLLQKILREKGYWKID
jgi:hypothetical protein